MRHLLFAAFVTLVPWASSAAAVCALPPAGSTLGFRLGAARHLTSLIHQGVLFRLPDQSGLDHHSYEIARYGYDGLLRVAHRVGQSQEFREQVLGRHTREEVLENVYRTFFARPADDDTPWSELIKAGESGCAMARIVASDEFFSKQIVPILGEP